MSEAKDDPFVIGDALDTKIREAERRAREEGRSGWDDPLVDGDVNIMTLQEPPADFEFTLAHWRAYQEQVRALVEGELPVRLTKEERRRIELGVRKLNYDIDHLVSWPVLAEKLRTARFVSLERKCGRLGPRLAWPPSAS